MAPSIQGSQGATRPPWLFPVGVLVASILFLRLGQKPPGPKVTLLHDLESAGKTLPSPKGRKISLGWNTCVDLLVDLPELATRLELSPTTNGAADPQKVSNNDDLGSAVAYWFSRGGAAERLVGGDSSDAAKFFEHIVSESGKVNGSRYRVGGNAALMATSLARLGCSVRLGGPIGDTLSKLLDPRIETVSPSGKDGGSLTDAVHLIMEYKMGQTMGDMIAPRANRFILVHDPLNARLAGLETLSDSIAGNQMDAFVASGLNQLEALETSEWEARLREVRSALSDLPSTVPIHLELASMADETFAFKMASTLFPLADSFGLNEQELAFVFEALGGRYSDFDSSAEALTGKVPDVHTVTNAIKFILKRADEWSDAASIGVASSERSRVIRRISRVHFHCLSYHIIAERDVTGREKWSTEMWRATAQGSTAATNNACGPSSLPAQFSILNALKSLVKPEFFDEPDLELLFDQPCPDGEQHNGVCQWSAPTLSEEPPLSFSLAPVLVCAHPRNTVGLGDAISSTGLAFSLK